MDLPLENPFIRSITQLLDAQGPWTEHQLLSELVAQGSLNRDYGRESLALFQAHFLTMNALYQIQSLNLSVGRYLSISAIKIEWLQVTERGGTELDFGGSNLRDYYCDWQNFAKASTESVEGLLDGFWQRFLSQDEKQAALAELDLIEPLEFTTVKARYRQLAMEYHPDRGGSDEALAKINNAYGTLKRCFSK